MRKLNNKFLNSIIVLMSGSLVAQIINIIIAPITTRLFSTEELGIYTLVLTANTMFGSVLSMRYDMSIVNEEDEENVITIVQLSFFICLLMSVLISAGYFIYFEFIHPIALNSSLIAIFVLGQNIVTGLINILISYNNRFREYKLITSVYVLRTVIQNICIVFSGLIKLGSVGLILSQILGYFFGLGKQAQSLLLQSENIKKVEYIRISAMAKKHKKQALWSAPAILANGCSYSIINFFVENLFGTGVLGLYSISYRVLGLPINVISANVSRVFFERASREIEENGNFRKCYYDTVKLMMIIAVPMLITLRYLAPPLITVVFGTEWESAGIYVKILAPMFILRFIAGAVNCSAIVVEKQKIDFIVQVMLLSASIIIFIFSKCFSLEINIFLQWINVCFSLIYILYIIAFWYCSGIEK